MLLKACIFDGGDDGDGEDDEDDEDDDDDDDDDVLSCPGLSSSGKEKKAETILVGSLCIRLPHRFQQT